MSKSYKYTTVTEKLQDAVSNAFSERLQLAEEMREWYDNLPESLQGGDKGGRIEEAASTLENIEEVDLSDLPDEILNREISFTEAIKVKGRSKTPSRDARRNNATARLSTAVDALREWADQGEEQIEQEEGDSNRELEEQVEKARELADSIEEHKDNADGVEFPGMFG